MLYANYIYVEVDSNAGGNFVEGKKRAMNAFSLIGIRLDASKRSEMATSGGHRFLMALGLATVLYGWGSLPVAAQGCDHHRHHNDDCWNGDGYSRSRGTAGYSTNYEGNAQTLQGRINEIDYLPGATPESAMVELGLSSAGQIAHVQLAPIGFLKRGGVLLKTGDSVTIKGVPVAGFQGDLILTVTLLKGDKSLALRDSRGRPLW